MHRPLDELDLELVHALQISPRMPWAVAGEILGVAPSTVAARWARLVAEGAAWLTAYPTPAVSGQVAAFVELAIDPQQRDIVVRRLVADPRVLSVEVLARRLNVVCTVFAPSLAALRRLTTEELPSWNGVQEVVESVVVRGFRDASQWRVGALDSQQSAAATAHARSEGGGAGAAPGRALADSPDLVAALMRDPRASVADLARSCGGTPATVRRHMIRLLGSGALTMRCDVDHAAAGWPVSATWFASVPAEALEQIGRALASSPAVRLCQSVSGRSNLMLSVFSRSLSGLADWEAAACASLPGLSLGESVLHVRFHKRMGRVLDADGRATSEVVLPALP